MKSFAPGRARIVIDHVLDDVLQQRLFLLEALIGEIADDESDRRLLQRAEGYRATIKKGAVTFEDGEPTGEQPGRLVRGAR